MTVSTTTTSLTRMQVVFQTAGTNYNTISDYCFAQIASTTTFLSCRRDPLVSSNYAYGITGFTYAGTSTVYNIAFRMTAANLNTINFAVNLQKLSSANVYTTVESFTSTGGSLTPIDTTSK